MAIPKSILTSVVNELPDDFVMKARSVTNFLTNKGQVKKEEMQFSGMTEKLTSAGINKLNKQDLQAMEANRDDFFGNVNLGDTHGSLTVPGTTGNTTDVRRFRSAKDTTVKERTTYDVRTDTSSSVFEEVPAKRNVASHFSGDVGDYIWHSRSNEATIGGLRTLNVQEIQSDIHQRGRRHGYGNRQTPDDTPFKDNWSTKAIEGEILKAAENGQQAIAIPLEGSDTSGLLRGTGVQEWYKTKVRATMKKIAKKIPGAKYVEVKPTLAGNAEATDIKNVSNFRDNLDMFSPENEAITDLEETIRASTGRDPQGAELLGALRNMNEGFWTVNPGLAPLRNIISETPQGVIAQARTTFNELPDDTRDAIEGIVDGYGNSPAVNNELNNIYRARSENEADYTEADLLDEMRQNFNDDEWWAEFPELRRAVDTAIGPQEVVAQPVATRAEALTGLRQLGMGPDSPMRQFEMWADGMVTEEVSHLNLLETAVEIHWDNPAFWQNNGLSGVARELNLPQMQPVATRAEASTGLETIYENQAGSFSQPGTPIYEFENWASNMATDEVSELEIMETTIGTHWDNPAFWQNNGLSGIARELNLPQMQGAPNVPVKSQEPDVTYGQIVLPEGTDTKWKDKLTLYSAAGATGLAASVSTEDAAADTQEEIKSSLAYMTEELGMDSREAVRHMNDIMQPIIEELRDEGYTEQEIREEMGGLLEMPDTSLMQGTVPDEHNFELVPIADKKNFDTGMQTQLLKSATAAAQNITEEYLPFLGEMTAEYITDNGEATEQYKYRERAITFEVSNVLRNLGYDVTPDEETGDLMYAAIDGTTKPITPNMWDVIQAAELELAGAFAGASGGLATVAKFFPGAGKAIQFGAAAIGGTLGASGGRQLDAVKNAWFTRQHLKNGYYMRRFQDSVAASAVFEIGGAAVLEMGRLGGKSIGWVYDMFVKGNRDGAYQALKDNMNLTDEQVNEIIKTWEASTDVPEPTKAQRFFGLASNEQDLAMKAVMETQPGGEAFIGAAGGMNSKMSAAVQISIDKRAKDVLSHAGDLTNDNLGVVLYDELGKYVNTVKAFYGGIKKLGINEFTDSTYRFDYDKLAIQPMLKTIESRITNPATQERFIRMSERMQELGEPGSLRNFEDLLDLRMELNDFLYNVKMKKIAKDSIQSTVNRVNAEIRKSAKSNMQDGGKWLKEWDKANIEYGKMKELKKNVLYKALTKPGVSPKKVITALKGNVDSIDGTFMEVVGKLPKRVRAQTEGAVMELFVGKHTIGEDAGFQAINFPALANELKHIGFSDPGARDLKRVINNMSEVYKNDANLARASGNVSKPSFQSYLTTDPVIRAKYELASGMFNYIKRLAPTQKGREIALVTRLAKIMEEPRNAKEIDKLIKELPDDPAIQDTLHQLSILAAKFGAPEIYPKVEVYRTGAPGNAHKAREGKLGKGIYWTTDKDKATKRAGSTGARLLTDKVLPTRVANREDLKLIAGDTPVEELKDNPKFIDALKAKGFDGITLGDEVLMFKQ